MILFYYNRLFRYNKCFKEACSNDLAGMARDDFIHGSLLVFNELVRIANFENENARLKLFNIGQSSRIRSIVEQNPIEWLLESIQPPTCESRTSRTLVTDYFQEVKQLLFCHCV